MHMGIAATYGRNQGRGRWDCAPEIARHSGAGLFAISGAWSRVAGLDMAVNERRQLRLGQGADLGGLDGAVLEDHERWNAAYAVLRRSALILVDVELGDFELAGVFLGNLVEDGRDHLARPAPFGPVV